MLTTRIIPCLDAKNGCVAIGTTLVELEDKGHVRSEGDIEALLEAGADEICIRSPAPRERRGGSPAGDWEVCTRGGRNPAGISASDGVERVLESSTGEILLTRLDREGTFSGDDLDLRRTVTKLAGSPVALARAGIPMRPVG